MILRVLSVAELEAADAAIWYDERQPGLGDDFFAELESAFARLRNSNERLAKLTEYRGPFDLRRFHLARFPYLLILQQRPEERVVLAVAHVRRRPLYWLNRLK